MLILLLILKFCLLTLLGSDQRITLFKFFDVLSALCDDVQDRGRQEMLLEETNVALALIERDFPISVQVQVYSILYY